MISFQLSIDKHKRAERMFFLFYFLNLIVIKYVWNRFRDYLNPVLIIFSIWTLLTGLYDILSRFFEGYRILSNTYYLFVMFFLYCYLAISMIVLNNVRRTNTNDTRYFTNSIHASVRTINVLLSLAIFSNIIYIVVLMYAAGSINPIVVMSSIRQLTRGENALTLARLIKVPALLFNFTPLLLCYILMFDIKANVQKTIILMIEMFFLAFLLATKGRILRFALLLIILLKNRFSKKYFRRIILLIIPIILFVLYVLVMHRDRTYFDTYTLEDYIFVYFLSPIPALDRLLCGELGYVTSGFGPRTLEYFHRLFGITSYFVDPGYIRITTPNGFVTTNVFTGLGMYFLDFGFYGAVFSGVFLSFIYTYIYKKMVMTRNAAYAIFYVVNYPYLLFHVFGDLIIGSISITIQEFLSAVIITVIYKKIRIGSFRIRKQDNMDIYQ